MAYAVLLKPSAKRALESLPATVQARLVRRMEPLAADPRPHGSQKMGGEDGHYRIRVGDYRFVYAVDDARRIVWITKIGHRGDVYRRR